MKMGGAGGQKMLPEKPLIKPLLWLVPVGSIKVLGDGACRCVGGSFVGTV